MPVYLRRPRVVVPSTRIARAFRLSQRPIARGSVFSVFGETRIAHHSRKLSVRARCAGDDRDGAVEIIITQEPTSNDMGSFSASGLTLGGEQTWSYVWTFAASCTNRCSARQIPIEYGRR